MGLCSLCLHSLDYVALHFVTVKVSKQAAHKPVMFIMFWFPNMLSMLHKTGVGRGDSPTPFM